MKTHHFCITISIAALLLSSCNHMMDVKKQENYQYRDYTQEYSAIVDDYASDSDMFSITEIRVGDTDYRNFVSLYEHSGIFVEATIYVHNTTSEDMKLWIETFSSVAGSYITDMITLVTNQYNYKREMVIKSSERKELYISNLGFPDGYRIFDFEPYFGYKEDYTADMIKLLAETKFMYIPDFTELENPADSVMYYRERTPIKPSRNIKVQTVNYEYRAFEYWWRNRIKKEEPPFVARYKELQTRYNLPD